MKKILSILIMLLAVITGCATNPPSSRLQKLSLGQNKEEVTTNIGAPRAVRGSIQNRYGQNIEVWEYRFNMPANTFDTFMWGNAAVEKRDYWLYFLEGQLCKWGQAGDWQIESQNIYELRFSTGKNL